ncbi:hypothetical protein JTB14_023612 [Gonioctena quinquepunctata]|nr:hypothetical protein JTB14_023612 [Gonioctena quinquepunctata]
MDPLLIRRILDDIMKSDHRAIDITLSVAATPERVCRPNTRHVYSQLRFPLADELRIELERLPLFNSESIDASKSKPTRSPLEITKHCSKRQRKLLISQHLNWPQHIRMSVTNSPDSSSCASLLDTSPHHSESTKQGSQRPQVLSSHYPIV